VVGKSVPSFNSSSVRSQEAPVDDDSAVGAFVQIENLCKFSRKERCRTVLKDISLKFEPGEFVVLLGHSGSGKSTLLNLISGIDQPTEGAN